MRMICRLGNVPLSLSLSPVLALPFGAWCTLDVLSVEQLACNENSCDSPASCVPAWPCFQSTVRRFMGTWAGPCRGGGGLLCERIRAASTTYREAREPEVRRSV